MTIQLLEKKQTRINNNKAFILHCITWQQFKELEKTFNSIAGVRLIYLDGVLEIMIIVKEHKYYKRNYKIVNNLSFALII